MILHSDLRQPHLHLLSAATPAAFFTKPSHDNGSTFSRHGTYPSHRKTGDGDQRTGASAFYRGNEEMTVRRDRSQHGIRDAISPCSALVLEFAHGSTALFSGSLLRGWTTQSGAFAPRRAVTLDRKSSARFWWLLVWIWSRLDRGIGTAVSRTGTCLGSNAWLGTFAAAACAWNFEPGCCCYRTSLVDIG